MSFESSPYFPVRVSFNSNTGVSIATAPWRLKQEVTTRNSCSLTAICGGSKSRAPLAHFREKLDFSSLSCCFFISCNFSISKSICSCGAPIQITIVNCLFVYLFIYLLIGVFTCLFTCSQLTRRLQSTDDISLSPYQGIHVYVCSHCIRKEQFFALS